MVTKRLNDIKTIRSIESFINQYYCNKELIIVSSHQSKTDINKIYNIINDRIQFLLYKIPNEMPLGTARNISIKLSSGEYICQWDDDDVALPWHLKNVAEQFTDDVNILHWATGVYYNNSAITNVGWIGNSGIVFRKSAWQAIGGHPVENAGYDMTFINALAHYGGRKFAEMPKKDASWFYMWGGRGYHMSGMGTDTSDRANVIERHSNHVEILRTRGLIPTGDVTLNPHWKLDYQKQLEDHVTENKSSNS